MVNLDFLSLLMRCFPFRGGGEVPVGVRDGPAHPRVVRLHHGRRDGPGQDSAVHRPHVDAAPPEPRRQARDRQGHRGLALQPGPQLVQRSAQVAGRTRGARRHRRRLEGRRGQTAV